MNLRRTIIRITTLLSIVLLPFHSWAVIGSPSPGSHYPVAGTDIEVEVQGYHSVGNTSFELTIENAYGSVYGRRTA